VSEDITLTFAHRALLRGLAVKAQVDLFSLAPSFVYLCPYCGVQYWLEHGAASENILLMHPQHPDPANPVNQCSRSKYREWVPMSELMQR
jgi:hypothetical protein